MYPFGKSLMVAALVAFGSAACNDQPTSARLNDVNLAALDDFGFTSGNGPAPGCATGPGTCFNGAGQNQSYVGGLVREAYQKLLSTQGQQAADAAFATLWQLHQEAFALRTGDRAAFVAAMQKAHDEAVRIVGEVLGIDVSSVVNGPQGGYRAGTQYRGGR